MTLPVAKMTMHERVDWDALYYVYILECADGTLYTGITNCLERRVKKHNAGEGAKYTRGRTPVKLVWFEQVLNRSLALKREAAIKKLSRSQKLRIIEGTNV